MRFVALILLALGGCSDPDQSIENGDFSQISFDGGVGAECIDEACTELVNSASRPGG